MALADIFAGKGSLAEKLKERRKALESGIDRSDLTIKKKKEKRKKKKDKKGYK